eukprot:3304726-Pyramimonas_sp.AAC.1
MTGGEKWFSLCKKIGRRYLSGITWTQSTVTLIIAARLDGGTQRKATVMTFYTHDSGCLMHEFPPNDPSRILQRVAEKLGSFDPERPGRQGSSKYQLHTLRYGNQRYSILR